MLVRYVVHAEEGVSTLGVSLLVDMATALAPNLDAGGWGVIVRALSLAASIDHLSTLINPARHGCTSTQITHLTYACL